MASHGVNLHQLVADEVAQRCNVIDGAGSWEIALVDDAAGVHGQVSNSITWSRVGNTLFGDFTDYTFTAGAGGYGNVTTLRINEVRGANDFYIDVALPTTYVMIESYQLEIQSFTIAYSLA
jgi:hypothetical protein